MLTRVGKMDNAIQSFDIISGKMSVNVCYIIAIIQTLHVNLYQLVRYQATDRTTFNQSRKLQRLSLLPRNNVVLICFKSGGDVVLAAQYTVLAKANTIVCTIVYKFMAWTVFCFVSFSGVKAPPWSQISGITIYFI